jgi:hypothetical protein
MLSIPEPEAPSHHRLGSVPPTPAEAAARLLERGDLLGDSLMLGRDAELARLVGVLRAGRNAVVVGERGVGKSRLLREAFEVLSGSRRRLDPGSGRVLEGGSGGAVVFWVWQTAPLGEMLDEMLTHLWSRGLLRFPTLSDAAHAEMLQAAEAGEIELRKLVRAHAPNSRAKRDAVLASLRPVRATLFLDQLERISPTAVAFLQALSEVATVATATPQIERKENLKRFWTGFVRVDLAPLAPATMARLLDHFLGTYPIYPTDRKLFRRQALAFSGGNPAHLKSVLSDAQRQKLIGVEENRGIGGRAESNYLNLGPLYVFGLLVFSLARIVTGGTAPQELYIILSVCSLVVLLVMRVFRVFFVFRPR